MVIVIITIMIACYPRGPPGTTCFNGSTPLACLFSSRQGLLHERFDASFTASGSLAGRLSCGLAKPRRVRGEVGRGDDAVGDPHRAQMASKRATKSLHGLSRGLHGLRSEQKSRAQISCRPPGAVGRAAEGAARREAPP